MCRYAMTSYKSHYACFNCRKTFKRKLLSDILGGYSKNDKETASKCPECANLMANMGLDFESPKKKDIKAWSHITILYKVGITFHSCGCSGPGYIPENKEKLVEHFTKIKNNYIEHQHFWARRREDPTEQSEIAKDLHQNDTYLNSIPSKMKTGTKKKPLYDSKKAQEYWNKKIIEIENRIKTIIKTN